MLTLLSLFGHDRQGERFLVTVHDDFQWRADLHALQRIGVIVNIGDLFSAEPYDNVAAVKAVDVRGFLRIYSVDTAA